jgi:peptidoglycan/LPS O-acetylase OafA/YrhL
MKDQSTNSEWTVLAGLRFLLALLVVMTHSEVVAPGSIVDIMLGHTGYPAVFGFLMISGYSIAHSIKKSPDGYLIRRIKRIYPTYLCALAFSTLVLVDGPLRLPFGQVLVAPSWHVFIGNLFMLQGILVPVIPVNGPLWSLSIEWWCYILAMLLIRFNNRISVAVMIASFCAMIVYSKHFGYVTASQYPLGWNVFLIAWAWLSGFVYNRDPSKLNFMLMLMLPMLMFELYLPLQFGSMVIAGSACMILFAKHIEIRSATVSKALNFLGNVSYPLYLIHDPMMWFIAAKTPIRHGSLIVAIIIAILLAGYYLATKLMAISRAMQPRMPAA